MWHTCNAYYTLVIYYAYICIIFIILNTNIITLGMAKKVDHFPEELQQWTAAPGEVPR